MRQSTSEIMLFRHFRQCDISCIKLNFLAIGAQSAQCLHSLSDMFLTRKRRSGTGMIIRKILVVCKSIVTRSF